MGTEKLIHELQEKGDFYTLEKVIAFMRDRVGAKMEDAIGEDYTSLTVIKSELHAALLKLECAHRCINAFDDTIKSE